VRPEANVPASTIRASFTRNPTLRHIFTPVGPLRSRSDPWEPSTRMFKLIPLVRGEWHSFAYLVFYSGGIEERNRRVSVKSCENFHPRSQEYSDHSYFSILTLPDILFHVRDLPHSSRMITITSIYSHTLLM